MTPAARLCLLAGLALGACTPTSTPSPATSAAPAAASTAPVAATSAAPAAAHSGTTVTFAGTAGQASGYLALPPAGGAQKHAAVIVLQEWWGLNDWIRGNADRFAAQGYVALAVDLYRGHATTDAGEAHELMRGLPEDRALADMKGAVDLLAARPDVDPARLGAVGWCMGGGFSLALAVAEPRLRAVAMNYGRLVTDPAAIQGIHAALLGNFAGDDRGIAPADVKAFEAALQGAKKTVDIKIYPGVGHAFMNPGNEKGYAKDAAADAWGRIDAFFAKQLGG